MAHALSPQCSAAWAEAFFMASTVPGSADPGRGDRK